MNRYRDLFRNKQSGPTVIYGAEIAGQAALNHGRACPPDLWPGVRDSHRFRALWATLCGDTPIPQLLNTKTSDEIVAVVGFIGLCFGLCLDGKAILLREPHLYLGDQRAAKLEEFFKCLDEQMAEVAEEEHEDPGEN